MGLGDRLRRLEDARRPEPEDKHERAKRLKEVREAAEQENERFFRELARERRTAFLESVGYEHFTSEDLRDERYLADEDVPPFEITEDGEVFSSRDAKPITDLHQTTAEIDYWKFHDEGYNPRGLIHDEETQGYYMPEPPRELAFSRDRFYFQRWAWACGWETSNPYFWSAPERLDA